MYVREYILRLSGKFLGLACCSAAVIYGGWSADNRRVRIGMQELTFGMLDGSWITGTERKHFHIFFPIYASIIMGMGVIFLIANRVNKQINKPPRF